MMNKIRIAFCALCVTSLSTMYAGKWVNWNEVVTDISHGVETVVEAGKEIKDSIVNKYNNVSTVPVITTKHIDISGVQSIEFSGAGSLIITHDTDKAEELVIEGDEASMSNIDVQIVNHMLIIKIKDTLPSVTQKSVTYRVNSRTVSAIDIAGTVVVEMVDIKMPHVSINVSGSSKISGVLSVDNLSVCSTGASEVVLSGKADKQMINIFGSGTFDGRKLKGETMTVNGSGTVNLYCNISDAIKGDFGGSGTLKYSGNPLVDVNSFGLVSLKKM